MKTIEEELYESLGINRETILVESGDYSSGFWKNLFEVDLELLLNGSSSAFSVVQDVHDTAGITFREYYGITLSAKLPSGVNPSAIVEFCKEILERSDELTEGFSVEWDNGNGKAEWENDKPDFWDRFSEKVSNLASREVYDMGFSENHPFIVEAIKKDLSRDLPEIEHWSEIETWLEQNDYYQTDDEFIFVNQDDFCRNYFRGIKGLE